MENSLKPGLGNVASQQINGSLNFHGVIRDENDRTVEGATVMLFASFTGGIERPLGSACTDREGAYLISVPQMPDHNGLLGFKVRAGKEYLLSEEFSSSNLIQVEETDKQENNQPFIDKALPAKYTGRQEETGLTVSPGQADRWPPRPLSPNPSHRCRRPKFIQR